MHRKATIPLALFGSAAAILLFAASCSTTKSLAPGQQRLKSTKILIEGTDDVRGGELSPYIRQRETGWSPFQYVYNWENGKGGAWDRFVHKLGVAPVIFDSLMVGSSEENLVRHLEYLGFYESTVKSTVASKNKSVKVTYTVIPGHRYPISSITYEMPSGMLDFRKDFYADTTNSTIKVGSFLSENDLEQETVRSAQAMRNKGYYDFNKNYFFFEADTLSHAGHAALKIRIKDNTRNEAEEVAHVFQQYRIGKISVTCPDDLKLRPSVLANLNNLSTGDMYSERRVNTLYSRLSSITLFNSVNVQLTPREDVPIVDCDISLQKSKTMGFKVGLEASVNSTGLLGISPELSFYDKNLFRGGEVFNLSVSDNNQFRFDNSTMKSNEIGVAASLIVPRFIPFSPRYFAGPNIPRTELKLSFNYQNRPEYTRRMMSGTFGYTGSYRRHLYYQFYPLSLNYVYMPRIDKDFEKTLDKNPFLKNAYQSHTDAGLSAALNYSSSSSSKPTESYWYARLTTDLSGNVLAAFNGVLSHNEQGQALFFGVPYSQYVRGEISLGRTLRLGKNRKSQLAGRILAGAGYAYGNSSALPFEKHFYSGGANSLRGWTARTVGPGSQPLQTAWVIPNQTGDLKLEANVEYRIPMVWKLEGAFFLDAGNVWNMGKNAEAESKFSFDTIAMSWGAGIRLDLNFLVLRLDYGIRLHDPALEKYERWVRPDSWFEGNNSAFHFGVGYPF